MTEPVRMRADQLSVGDLVPDAYLPHRFNKGPAEVRFVAPDGEGHTFFAFRYPNGQHDSTTVLSVSALEIWPAPAPTGLDYSRPADSDDPQPSGGREPMHTGAWTDGGLVDETEGHWHCPDHPGPLDDARDHVCRLRPGRVPPWNPETGFFQPGRVPELVGDDLPRRLVDDGGCPPDGCIPNFCVGADDCRRVEAE